MVRRFLTGLVAVVYCSMAHAEPPAVIGCGIVHCTGAFGSTTVGPNGDVLVKAPDGANTSQLACQLNGGTHFTLRANHPGFKAIYSQILMSQATQKVLMLRIVDGSSTCDVQYSVLYP